MLRLQLSLNNQENLGELHIRKVGGDDKIADYHVCLYDGPWKMDKQSIETAYVKNYDRSLGAWKLVIKALRAIHFEPYRRKNG